MKHRDISNNIDRNRREIEIMLLNGKLSKKKRKYLEGKRDAFIQMEFFIKHLL